jgi:hypothetical protein
MQATRFQWCFSGSRPQAIFTRKSQDGYPEAKSHGQLVFEAISRVGLNLFAPPQVQCLRFFLTQFPRFHTPTSRFML